MICKRYLMLTVAVAAIAAAGCHKASAPVAQDAQPVEITPYEQSILTRITDEMHRSIAPGQKSPTTYEEWVDMVHPTDVPPPPQGTKYIINQAYRITLVAQ